MNIGFSYGAGFIGMILSIAMIILPYVVYYFIIRAAINKSNITDEIYALRRDLNELENRQAERFKTLDNHFQQQNQLLREQNEMMLRAERDRSQ
ncbi:hypothetical protein [Saccharibacillus endophyticus]|uniref:Uncharacterized protein n=1 Tax=Saccharibacillus endophyticus TaxID=2060666 RepID=A0ABQ1ZWQ6_9BACL|nr:hypothetical protein [Saccharibacillus endophyticus]GGH79131.1 hypothetical protein GCM10007362_25460 [Saccharibacillus endophyticus]